MCGIAGAVAVNKDQQEIECVFRETLKERGPDHFGRYIAGEVQLYHSRLAIIDLSEDANQPMIDPESGNVIVFNGEIYNFPELKQELTGAGVSFKTRSDTEVLLKGYAYWGIKRLLERADGMFAFALHDIREQKMWLARDRFGKKPLYYSHNNGGFTFSSNIVSLSRLYRNELSFDQKLLDYYLREMAMPQPHTVWKEVKQLPAASYMSYDIVSSTLSQPTSYWSLAHVRVEQNRKEDYFLEKTEHLLKEGLKRRLISDVPIGFFLSGGIDSGLIVAYAAEMFNKPIDTFTVGFDDEKRNEAPEARLIAEKYGTNHNEIFLEPNVRATAEKVVAYVGEPFGDYSLIPSYEVCEAIRGHATVAISGDGGDELFSGYRPYVNYYASQKVGDNALTSIRLNASKVLSRLWPDQYVNLGPAAAYRTVKSPQQAMLRVNGALYRQLRQNQPFFQESLDFTHEYMESANEHYFEGSSAATQQQLTGLRKLLLNNYLPKVDRASMINSLEVRSPFLDYRLAEFAFSIPDHIKLKQYRTKYVLKKLACEKFDRNVFKEPKRGFVIPLNQWLRTSLKSWAEELLFDSLAKRQIFDKDYMTKLWKEHQGVNDHTDIIWRMMALELWYSNHYD